MESLGERKELRTRFMNDLFEVAGGSEGKYVQTEEIASGLDLSFNRRQREDRQKVLDTVQYLEGEGLIQVLGDESRQVKLTHQGIREVEQAKNQPNRPTEHFAPISVIYAETITNSNIQQGSPEAFQSLNVLGQEQVQEVEPVVRDLRARIDDLGLEDDDRSELEAEIQTLESQMASPKPKRDIIESGLRSAQRIVEGAAAGAASSGLLQTIQMALASF